MFIFRGLVVLMSVYKVYSKEIRVNIDPDTVVDLLKERILELNLEMLESGELDYQDQESYRTVSSPLELDEFKEKIIKGYKTLFGLMMWMDSSGIPGDTSKIFLHMQKGVIAHLRTSLKDKTNLDPGQLGDFVNSFTSPEDLDIWFRHVKSLCACRQTLIEEYEFSQPTGNETVSEPPGTVDLGGSKISIRKTGITFPALDGGNVVEVKETESVNSTLIEVKLLPESPDVNLTVHGEGSDDFYVDNRTIRIQNRLDFETRQLYNLMIGDGDGVNTSLIVVVLDANDEVPEVVVYSGTLAEETSIGTVIGGFYTVTDADNTDNLTLSLTGTGSGSLSPIGKGQLKVVQRLDRETRGDTYFDDLTLTVTDLVGHMAKVKLNVSLLDVNDNPPKCDMGLAALNVSQVLDHDVELLNLTALCHDRDTGDNARLTYTILGGSIVMGVFNLKNGTLVANAGHLNSTEFAFWILVKDSPENEPPRKTYVRIIIHVIIDEEDTNVQHSIPSQPIAIMPEKTTSSITNETLSYKRSTIVPRVFQGVFDQRVYVIHVPIGHTCRNRGPVLNITVSRLSTSMRIAVNISASKFFSVHKREQWQLIYTGARENKGRTMPNWFSLFVKDLRTMKTLDEVIVVLNSKCIQDQEQVVKTKVERNHLVKNGADTKEPQNATDPRKCTLKAHRESSGQKTTTLTIIAAVQGVALLGGGAVFVYTTMIRKLASSQVKPK